METRKIHGEVYKISQNAEELFGKNTLKQKNANNALIYMNDCIDLLYNMAKPYYPKVFKPEVYIADSNKQNAVALGGKEIIIYAGLLWDVDKLIRKRYTKEILERYNILRDYSIEEIISGIRIYTFRFIVLHELYHLWNGHHTWQRKYYFDKNGDLKDKTLAKAQGKSKFSNARVIQEHLVKHKKHTLKPLNYQELMSMQAFEIDADSSAVCMLINLLMRDTEAKNIQEKVKYVRNEMGLIICALAVTFSLFDGNAGAKFERLKELETTTHPISAIRMVYAIEIAECCLENYFIDNDLGDIESEWLKILCDVESDYDGKVDMGQVFYFPAYTEKAQHHLCHLKKRITDMYDTLLPMALGNTAPKLEKEDIEFCDELVRFTEDGKSTKGWINPSSGKSYAKRAPIVKKKMPERNDPCPCGSGKKYKYCCGKE